MRGARNRQCRLSYALGIIPADAGSTNPQLAFEVFRKDHPRGCGEHRLLSRVVVRCAGSSSRMRGAQLLGVRVVEGGGIIPADAGSTYREPKPGANGGDHPRGCGEHIAPTMIRAYLGGSSPRMRGAQSDCRHRQVGAGIIPADAGSTR